VIGMAAVGMAAVGSAVHGDFGATAFNATQSSASTDPSTSISTLMRHIAMIMAASGCSQFRRELD
jgi:hypothetical protein